MSIINMLKKTSQSIFTKLTYQHDLAITLRSYSAVNMSLDEVFTSVLQSGSYKTAQLLLSSGKLNLNYEDSNGNSPLMNIIKSQNTSLLKNYFNKAAEEPNFKLPFLMLNKSGHTIYNIADDNKEVLTILHKGVAQLQYLDKIRIQPLKLNTMSVGEKDSFLNKIDLLTSSLDSLPSYSAVCADHTKIALPLYPTLNVQQDEPLMLGEAPE